MNQPDPVDPPLRYAVWVDDNLHFMDENARSLEGRYARADEAVAVAPFVQGEPPVPFSAREYAKERCQEI